jgi:hypothetical protein
MVSRAFVSQTDIFASPLGLPEQPFPVQQRNAVSAKNRDKPVHDIDTVIVYKQGMTVPITYTATADGSTTAATTKIDFEFGKNVTGLMASDITLGGSPGVAGKGALTGSGKNWSLGITVTTAGAATVSIAKSGVESGARPITLYKPSTGGGGPLIWTEVPTNPFGSYSGAFKAP